MSSYTTTKVTDLQYDDDGRLTREVTTNTQGDSDTELVQRIRDLAGELEEPVVRAAVMLPPYETGMQDGADSERLLLAERLREMLTLVLAAGTQ
jgi:hypothetical protein